MYIRLGCLEISASTQLGEREGRSDMSKLKRSIVEVAVTQKIVWPTH